MRCDFCGEDIEGTPFQKDGMVFCSLECSDAMEGGENIPLGEEVLDDPDDFEEEDEEDLVGIVDDDDDENEDDEEDEVYDDFDEEDYYDADERGY